MPPKKSKQVQPPKRNKLRRASFLFFAAFLVYDLVLTMTRRRHFQCYLPILQSLLHTPGSDGTFAQNYQDVWFLRVASYNGWVGSVGFFVDIGAYNGIWCSNTKLLETKLSWNGVCVDLQVDPHSFDGRTCQLFQNAMSSSSGKDVTFTGRNQERAISLRPPTRAFPTSSAAKTINFPALLQQSNAPRFIPLISIDIEGHEYEVLTRFQFSKYEVGVWIIERSPSSWSLLRKLLHKHGYIKRNVTHNGVDGYFTKDKYWTPTLSEKKLRSHPFLSHGC